jgi:hypothetical protein
MAIDVVISPFYINESLVLYGGDEKA